MPTFFSFRKFSSFSDLRTSCAVGMFLLGTGLVTFEKPLGLVSRNGHRLSTTVFAADTDSKSTDQYDRSVSGVGKIKLNYYSASWARVFQDLSDTFNMEFVGDQMPSGRFSRNDHAEHTRKDAIRIVNHEIEPQGFRLVEKGRFLILLETTLRRPKAPVTTAKAPQRPAPRIEANAEASDDQQEMVEQPRRSTPEPESQPNRNPVARPASHPIRQVSFLDSDEEPHVEQFKKLVEQIEHWNAPTAPQVQLVRLNHVQSSPTAELLKSIFGPTNSASRSGQSKSGLSIVEIPNANSVMILAAEAELESVTDLIEKIDVQAEPNSEFQIFRWRASQSKDVETVLDDLSEQEPSLAERSLLIANARTNSIIVRAHPKDLDEIEAWMKKLAASASR